MSTIRIVIILLTSGIIALLGAGINDVVDGIAIRKRMKVILQARPHEFKEKFPEMLFLAAQVKGSVQENRIFQLIEEIGQDIRQKNIYETKELNVILEQGIQRWTKIYNEELNNYRKTRETDDAIIQKSTDMFNYMICAGILYYATLNFEEAKIIFEKLIAIIPSDLWVQKYNKKIKEKI